MKYFLNILFFTGLTITGYSQTWGKCTFGQFTNEAVDVEVDASNNVYITGYVTGETAFEFSSVVPSAAGNGDIYVAKYSSSGVLLWKKTFGGNFSDRAVDLAIGPDNNIVITGQYFGSVNFDAFNVTSINNTKDIFLAKLNPLGVAIWARSEGGNMADNAYGVTVDHQNNVILTGQFQGNANIAGNNYVSAIDPNTGLYSFDLFISKYDSNGNPLWARNGTSDYDDRGLAVSVDHQDNIFFTGQFSKNFQFNGQNYPNLGYNIGLLCKLTPSGQTTFFNQMRGGMTLPYDLEINNQNEVIVTGDYLGNLNYYDNAGPHAIMNNYSKKIFVLKTANTGAYTWSHTIGSNNEISAKSVSCDASNNVYVTGYFKCDLSQIQDTATTKFNSAGFKDLFLLRVLNNGSFSYIKQAGGKMDDEGLGVALFSTYPPYVCGSFTKDFNIPSSSSFVSTGNGNHVLHSSPTNETPHCYLLGDSTRNSLLTNSINEFTSAYNYFIDPLLTDSVEGEIQYYNSSNLINDTLRFCTKDSLRYVPGTYSHFGPSYHYLWDNGNTFNKRVVTTTGDYYVDAIRDDQCVTERDSIYAISEPVPVSPLLTDNLNINNQTPPLYSNYHFCYPDSVTINLTPQANTDTIYTTMNNNTYPGIGPHLLNLPGLYIVYAKNQYCARTSKFIINIDHVVPYDTVAPKIIMAYADSTGDSISVCYGSKVYFSCIDTLTNTAQTYLPDINEPLIDAGWSINGTYYTNYQNMRTHFTPGSSGWYTVTCYFTLGYSNLCGLDTTKYSTTKQFYITVLPLPYWSGFITGDNTLCLGGSVFLVQSNPQSGFNWSGPGIIWNNHNDSIEINASGSYSYSGSITDTLTGCHRSFTSSYTITLKEAPNILSNPVDRVICPYDSIYLYLPTNYQSYQWVGPDGDTISNTYFCYGDIAGSYYCHVVDATGCHLTTPPIQLEEYTTPSLFVYPDEFICQGDQITMQTTYSGNATFVWSTGQTTDQIVCTQPGIYWVHITQCGITTSDTVELIDGSFTAHISAVDTLLCFQESVNIVGDFPTGSYEWNNGTVTGSVYNVDLPGAYSAVVTNEYGCTAHTNTINVSSIPESAPVYLPFIEVCLGSSGTLTTNSPYPVSWFNPSDTSFIFMGNTITINPVNVDTTFLIATLNSSCPPVYSTTGITIMDTLDNFQIFGDSIVCFNFGTQVHVNTQGENVSWSINGQSLGTNPTQPIASTQLNLGNNIVQVVISNACYSKTVTDTIFVPVVETISLVDDSISLCYYDTGLASINEAYDSIYWNVNGTQILTEDLFVQGDIQYNPIVVQAIDQYGCYTATDTLWVTTPVYEFNANVTFPNFCIGDSGAIEINTNVDSIQILTPWHDTINGLSSITFYIDSIHAGTYTIDTWDNLGCHYTDTVVIPIFNVPSVSILPDSIFCLNDIYTFYFPNDTNTYYWTTFGSNTSIPIQFDQNLILTVTSPQGCMNWDTLVVHTVNCDNELPNIMTPNGDGMNDVFIIDDAYSQHENALIIKNRYGNIVFKAQPYINNFTGENLTEGVYFYMYYPEGLKNEKNNKPGFLELVR